MPTYRDAEGMEYERPTASHELAHGALHVLLHRPVMACAVIFGVVAGNAYSVVGAAHDNQNQIPKIDYSACNEGRVNSGEETLGPVEKVLHYSGIRPLSPKALQDRMREANRPKHWYCAAPLQPK